MSSKALLPPLHEKCSTAQKNQVFIDFLAQLHAYCLKRRRVTTFQSVILAGVYDVRNVKRNFNKKKTTGVRKISIGGKTLVEAVV